MRCELLSKTCIFDILNNLSSLFCLIRSVVNCFQKLVSLIFWTTDKLWQLMRDELWIAFKNLYLWYSEQLCQLYFQSSICCELLSKTCIFDILNNRTLPLGLQPIVVNCFQKLVSLIFWTTMLLNGYAMLMLWIAFKNLYLWYSEQLPVTDKPHLFRCELLSKTCIFDILNNLHAKNPWWLVVVNCFQKLVSLIFWTTNGLRDE